ncbi:hypothetical protein OVA29_09550 [Exiguobacterium sp. SL14]|nr:hypothetical protein [Exiguobacterium sp. SL14]MCY1690879.1 hypothetical protein [Exiguobacterium sp. SL14]
MEAMTYKEMILKTADIMGKRQPTIDIPLLTVKLSRLWVTLVSGEPKETVYPLVESMVHEMVADPEKMVPGISDGKITFEQSVRDALKEEAEQKDSSSSSSSKPDVLDVRSVQRVLLPKDRDADWVTLTIIWIGCHHSPARSFPHQSKIKSSGSIFRFMNSRFLN